MHSDTEGKHCQIESRLLHKKTTTGGGSSRSRSRPRRATADPGSRQLAVPARIFARQASFGRMGALLSTERVGPRGLLEPQPRRVLTTSLPLPTSASPPGALPSRKGWTAPGSSQSWRGRVSLRFDVSSFAWLPPSRWTCPRGHATASCSRSARSPCRTPRPAPRDWPPGSRWGRCPSQTRSSWR